MSRYPKPKPLMPPPRHSPAADPAKAHKCDECGRVRGDCTRALHGRDAERWVCAPCLERLGQGSLLE